MPPDLTGPGTLHLQFAETRTLSKAIVLLERSASRYCRAGHLVSVDVGASELVPVLETLVERLTPVEQGGVCASFESVDAPANPGDRFESGSLARFLARRRSAWLVEMIEQGRLTSVFQPIVRAEDGLVYGYECLLRGIEGGRLVEAARLLHVAGAAGLLFHIDQAARSSALREAARHGIRHKIFINFTPAGSPAGATELASTMALLEELGISRQQVVFEIIETEQVVDQASLEVRIAQYRALGFAVALDDVGAGYSSLSALQHLRPDYVKLDAGLIRDVDRDRYKAVLTAKLLEASAELGVLTIAEGVETAGEREWLLAHGARLLQGFYIARPASPPPAAATFA